MLAASGSRWRIWAAPCQSISRITSSPPRSVSATQSALVPYRLPNTSACSRNRPSSTMRTKVSRLVKW